METQSTEPQPEEQPVPEPTTVTQTEPALEQDTQPSEVAQEEATPVKPAKPPLSRLRLFWRTSLIWLAVVFIAFLVGMLTFYFIRYKPISRSLAQINQTNTDLQKSLDGLNAQLTAANSKVTSLESDNQALQTKADDANAHVQLLQAMVEVSNARLALVNGNVTAAKAALVNTSQLLEALAPQIATVDANLATSMPQRLELILSGLDTDEETAKVDLDLLAKNLLDVETVLFGQ
jgi:uncharacterized protein YoxC